MCGYILCPKCKEIRIGTRHHVFPRRHFDDPTILYLCRDCHDIIERMIPMRRKHKDFYIKITKQFLGEYNGQSMHKASKNMSGKRRAKTKKIYRRGGGKKNEFTNHAS